MSFAIPMVRREGKDHIIDSYFCMINLKGINCKNKPHIQFPIVPSAIRPIPHCSDFPVPWPDYKMEYSSDSKYNEMSVVAGVDTCMLKGGDQPVPLTQAELNHLTQDLNLSKDSAQLLGSSQREISVDSRNNIPLVLRLWMRIKTVFPFPGWVNIGLLQQHCWIDWITELRVWCYRMEIFYWLIHRKSQSSCTWEE